MSAASAVDPRDLALTLARRILADVLGGEQPPTVMVRVLAARIGQLEQGITSALTVMDQLAPAKPEAGS